MGTCHPPERGHPACPLIDQLLSAGSSPEDRQPVDLFGQIRKHARFPIAPWPETRSQRRGGEGAAETRSAAMRPPGGAEFRPSQSRAGRKASRHNQARIRRLVTASMPASSGAPCRHCFPSLRRACAGAMKSGSQTRPPYAPSPPSGLSRRGDDWRQFARAQSPVTAPPE